MKGLTLGLTIAAVVILVVGVSLAIFFNVFFKQMKTSGVERIQERFPTEQIVLSETTANYFGLESRGSLQIRGNGVLVLTQDELWFSRLVKREDISIPTNTIQAVRLVDSHLGKRILGRQLIYVQFEGSDGADSVAWLVADPNRWQTEIASLIENGQP